MKKKSLALVLAAGSGSRMNAREKKQYMEIYGRPVFYYSLAAFEHCREIDDVILVIPEEDEKQVREYLEKWSKEGLGLSKLKAIAWGGKERYDSVYSGLQTAAGMEKYAYVLIHDSARPMLNETMIQTALKGAVEYRACVLGVPVKDTIKILDQENYVSATPVRSSLWAMQTPQAFEFPLILGAYQALFQEKQQGKQLNITDDAMVLEYYGGEKVKILEGDYRNIKITTPEDLILAELYLK